MTIPELNTIEIVLHGPETHDAHIAEVRLSEKRAAKILADAKAQREAEAQARTEAERRRWEAGEI